MDILKVSPSMAKMPGMYCPGLPLTFGMWSKVFGTTVVSCDHVPVSRTESPRVMRKVPSSLNVYYWAPVPRLVLSSPLRMSKTRAQRPRIL